MRVVVQPFNSVNLARIVQLINKTNQFNLTGLRTNEAEVKDWMARDNFYSQTVRLSDRFGDFGLTGILFGFIEDGTLNVRNWLMSCRILGRGIEECMLANARPPRARRGCQPRSKPSICPRLRTAWCPALSAAGIRSHRKARRRRRAIPAGPDRCRCADARVAQRRTALRPVHPR